MPQSPIFSKGITQIYWGDGKGKTTAALGSALRACGAGLRVHLVQFMKDGAPGLESQVPGEIKALEKFSNFSYARFGSGDWCLKNKDDTEHASKAKEALNYLSTQLNKFDLIIADEILYALSLGLLNEEEIISIIKSKPQNLELILTGSHQAFENLFEYADLITHVKKIKHPYDKGLPARKGIEY
jgi:cob(I)alamin adenosyltransferase